MVHRWNVHTRYETLYWHFVHTPRFRQLLSANLWCELRRPGFWYMDFKSCLWCIKKMPSSLERLRVKCFYVFSAFSLAHILGAFRFRDLQLIYSPLTTGESRMLNLVWGYLIWSRYIVSFHGIARTWCEAYFNILTHWCKNKMKHLSGDFSYPHMAE